MSEQENASGAQVSCPSLLDIARTALQAEAVRRAALEVVKAWQAGIITTKEGYGCGGLTLACLRDALGGFVLGDVIADVSNDQAHSCRVSKAKEA